MQFAALQIVFEYQVLAHLYLCRTSAVGRVSPVATDGSRPILLKKSAVVSTAEKYALEIEIFILSRGCEAQISRSGAQNRRFQRSVCGQSGETDFFNRIDPLQTFG